MRNWFDELDEYEGPRERFYLRSSEPPYITYAVRSYGAGLNDTPLPKWSDLSTEDIQDGVEQNPGDHVLLYQLADRRGEDGDHTLAIESLQALLDIAPKEWTAWLNYDLGMQHYWLGQWSHVVARLNVVVDLMPDHPCARYNRATCRATLGDLSGALTDMNLEVASELDDAVPLVDRGIVLSQMGRFPQAILDFDRACDLLPRGYYSQAHRGYARMCMGDLEAAGRDIAESLAGDPDCSLTHCYRGLLLDRNGDEVEAEAALQRALELSPGNWEAHRHMAVFHMKHGRPDEAAAAFNEVVRIRPTDPEAHYSRGLALDRAGFSVAAREDMERAISIDGKFIPAKVWLRRRSATASD